MRKTLAVIVMSLALVLSARAQSKVSVIPFQAMNDSLKTLFEQRTTVINTLVLKSVTRRGTVLDLHYDNSLGDYPWREGDVEWFRATVKSLLPEEYKSYSVDNIYSKTTKLEDLVTPSLGYDGKPVRYRYNYDALDRTDKFVSRIGARRYGRGMSGRIIALWQSHGRFYDKGVRRWTWQRPPLHRTVEDMFTQSFVLPFLIPMLENAGAYVIDPRERDIQKYEVIADNDPSFTGPRPLPMRQAGSYSEQGGWQQAGEGFADIKPTYLIDENPFLNGSARVTSCVEGDGDARATWSFKVPERGEYAVYVSYKSFDNSSENAHYTIRHLGGKSEFLVNQKMSGSTWVYLGTFTFGPEAGSVVLDNGTHGGKEFRAGRVVSADAVKIGGGMGKVARGPISTSGDSYEVSGMPAFAEGALYSMQWAGVDTSITAQWEGDYTRDFASRGAWTSMMTGGSIRNPGQEGKGVPVDLSFGFHTDAGVTPNDSIVGTLSIYTLMADTPDKKSRTDKLPDGRNRAVCRHYADVVQSQIVNDVRAQFAPDWARRCVWDRSYSESRTTGVPAMLLELLSHQNFADMRYGLDPAFRFTVCRSIYKGMLKFMSDLYAEPYVVQPLPVNSFAARLDGSSAELCWKATADTLEPTAVQKGFILYTRKDDGCFDQGTVIRDVSSDGEWFVCRTSIEPGHIYSYRIAAYNDGGCSFPSETLSLGIPASGDKGRVMVVNCFDRISAPTWFDTPAYAGFEGSVDSGVPYMYDISLLGEDYQHRRDQAYESNDNPGFGATRQDMACSIIPGNTFDYPYIHGKALMQAGYSFYSVSRDAWTSRNELGESAAAADLICGKQVTTRIGNGSVPDRYKVYPAALQKAIRCFTAQGRGIIISGADIATDVWDRVFPVEKDAKETEATKDFVQNVLGYAWASGFGSFTGSVTPVRSKAMDLRSSETIDFWREYNNTIYKVDNPDGIKPAGKKSTIIMRYSDTEIPAAVAYNADSYRVISFGWPLETTKDLNKLSRILDNAVIYCKKK